MLNAELCGILTRPGVQVEGIGFGVAEALGNVDLGTCGTRMVGATEPQCRPEAGAVGDPCTVLDIAVGEFHTTLRAQKAAVVGLLFVVNVRMYLEHTVGNKNVLGVGGTDGLIAAKAFFA